MAAPAAINRLGFQHLIALASDRAIGSLAHLLNYLANQTLDSYFHGLGSRTACDSSRLGGRVSFHWNIDVHVPRDGVISPASRLKRPPLEIPAGGAEERGRSLNQLGVHRASFRTHQHPQSQSGRAWSRRRRRQNGGRLYLPAQEVLRLRRQLVHLLDAQGEVDVDEGGKIGGSRVRTVRPVDLVSNGLQSCRCQKSMPLQHVCFTNLALRVHHHLQPHRALNVVHLRQRWVLGLFLVHQQLGGGLALQNHGGRRGQVPLGVRAPSARQPQDG